MDLAPVLKPIRADMQAVDALIRVRLDSDVVLIRRLADYIINSGGKRLRPALVLLCARANGYQGYQHILLATIIEFIHTATLLHDDVVDAAPMRRGQATASSVWGNGASVLTGDFLYSRAFQMMVELERAEVMATLADATNRIAEGEVLQLLGRHNADVSEAAYIEMVDRKTASLFAAGARLGALLADQPPARCQAMADFGRSLGVAFQVVDDALDYNADSAELGKNIGADLAEGKTTLPLIHAIASASPQQAIALRSAIETGNGDELSAVKTAIETSQAMTYTFERAGTESRHAAASLDGVPDSPFKTALQTLCRFAVQRRF